jgi:hypothetical protein
MDGWGQAALMDGRTDGRMDGWMDGWDVISLRGIMSCVIFLERTDTYRHGV